MFNFRSLSVGCAALLSLNIGACSDKDKTALEKTPQSVKAAVLVNSGDVDYKAFLAVEPRNVKDSDADAALKSLGLFKQKAAIKWGDRTLDSGTYTFSDVTLSAKNKETGKMQPVTIQSLVLTGVHMDGGKATFDRADLSNIASTTTENSLTLDRATFARPTPAAAQTFLGFLSHGMNRDANDAEDFGSDLSETLFGFDAAKLSDLSLSSKTGTVSLADMNYAKDGNSDLIFTDMETLAVSSVSEDGAPVSFSFDALSLHGLNKSLVENAFSDPDEAMNFGLPKGAEYQNMHVKNLKANFDTMSLVTDGWQSQADTSGAIQKITQILQPMTIRVGDDAVSPAILSLSKALKDMGYEKLVLSGQQVVEMNTETDRAVTRDSFVTLEDGFTLKFNSDLSGLNAVTQTVRKGETAPQAALNALIVNSLDVSLTDNSLVDRAFTFIAEKQGSSVSVLKMQAKSVLMLASLSAKSKEDGVVIANVAGALGEFLEEGGTFEMKIAPENPLSMADIQNLAASGTSFSKLGLSAQTTKP